VEELSPRLLDFDATRKPTAPRDAATVVVLRDGDAGLEVFCVRRHDKSGFLGGAVVFPGGKVDASDHLDAWASLVTAPHPRTALLGSASAGERALAIAACRETLEEGAILPVVGALDHDGALGLRAELSKPLSSPSDGSPLAASVAAHALTLRLDALVPWARWVTPEAETRRFDARFFLLALPAGQEGKHDQHETTMSFWGRPSAVLDRSARGEIFLAPPTLRTLELMAAVRDLGGALRLADEQPLAPICPCFFPADATGAPYLALPGDPSHPVPERRVAGPSRYVLRDGRFHAEDPPRGPTPRSEDAL
jgi:8-oxo-dGTP pyrophosphatase MutT (NUDIX family)